MTKVDKLLLSIEDLPPFPQVAQKAMAALGNPDCSVEELVHIIEYDQAITANVLRFCNSAYLGLPEKIRTLHQAIPYLGQKKLLSIIQTCCSMKYFAGSTPGYDLRVGELWRHSVSCAILSQILGEKIQHEHQDELFTAGLLHDIGKLVLSIYVEEDFDKIYNLVQKNNLSFLEAEQEVIGMDHAQVGGNIVRKWEFPDSICQCVEYHHKPDKISDSDYLTTIVHIADLGCMVMGIGVGEDGLLYRYYPQVLERYQFSQNDFDKALDEMYWEMGRAEDLITMV